MVNKPGHSAPCELIHDQMSYGTTEHSIILHRSEYPQHLSLPASAHAAFGILHRYFLTKQKHNWLLVKYPPLNVNSMPSSTGPVKACEILLHHGPSFHHKLGNSAVFPFSPLMPTRATAQS